MKVDALKFKKNHKEGSTLHNQFSLKTLIAHFISKVPENFEDEESNISDDSGFTDSKDEQPG